MPPTPLRPVALVTGASGGIGEEIARLLAARGHDLVLVARSADRLQALAGELSGAHGVRVHVLPEDLSDPRAPARLEDAVQGLGLELDVLVNNAGYGLSGAFAQADIARTMGMVQLNVAALTELTRLFLPGMVARGRGRVLNVASTAAFVPGPFMAVYYATKAYVLSLGDALAVELEGTGVSCTTLCPGATRTGFDRVAGLAGSKLFHSSAVMDARTVAQAGVEGLFAGRTTVIPGFRNRLLVAGGALATRRLKAKVARTLNLE